MTVYTLSPVDDARWKALVEEHPRASVFHTPEWAQALQKAYGYAPVVYTTAPPGRDLTNGVILAQVRSWITGNRLVSVPFADHCDVLGDEAAAREVLGHVQRQVETESLRYVELRPEVDPWPSGPFGASDVFVFHKLDLRPPVSDLFGRLHADGIRRKVRRADRDRLGHEQGRSDALLKAFHRLLTMTRRRHGVPPQPLRWFECLRESFGDRLNIRVALKDARPVASILTLRHRDTLFYKYGASDAVYHSTGAMPFLLWKAIDEGKAAGMQTLDLGRSDADNQGLVTFKRRWGAAESRLTYLRYPAIGDRDRRAGRATKVARGVVRFLPDAVIVRAGRILYRHMG
jgi:hypothetical protein